jgi:hypothetical protein
LHVLQRFLIVEFRFTATGVFIGAYAFIAHGQVFAITQAANDVPAMTPGGSATRL